MNSDETLEQPTEENQILQAISDLSKKLDDYKKQSDAKFNEVNAQLEAIRQGIVDNSARFDRLEGNFLLLRANITELTEEVRHNRKVVF